MNDAIRLGDRIRIAATGTGFLPSVEGLVVSLPTSPGSRGGYLVAVRGKQGAIEVDSRLMRLAEVIR